MKRITLILLVIVLFKESFSQSCNDVLIPDKSRTIRDRDKATMLISILNQENIQTYEDYKNSKFNATIPIDDVLVGLSFEQNSKGFKKFQNCLYTYSFNSVRDKEFLDQSIERLSDASIAAWRYCMSRNGFHVWVEQQLEPNTFILAGEYRDGGEHASPKLTNVSFSEAVIVMGDGTFTDRNGNTNRTFVFSGNTQRQIFKRTTNKSLTITVSATVGDGFNKTLGSISNTNFTYSPTKQSKGESTGEWNKKITFFNDKQDNVIAEVSVFFKLVRLSPDESPSSVKSVTLYMQDGDAWTELQSSGPINWDSNRRVVELKYYVPINAMSSQTFRASIGLWDRFNSSNSGIDWEVDY